MDNTEKFTNNKQIISFLIEQFPLCFTKAGTEAKSLKIGIFQELALRLADNERLSKTQLRGALRQYTLSWRYLHCVKVGAKRVDLDGVEGDEVSQEHADHAVKTLKESKEKAFANQKKTAPTKKAAHSNTPASKTTKQVNVPNRSKKPEVIKADVVKEEIVDLSKFKEAKHSELKISQEVKVLLGKSPVSATVTEIMKDDVQVQLSSGMVVKVKAKHLIV